MVNAKVVALITGVLIVGSIVGVVLFTPQPAEDSIELNDYGPVYAFELPNVDGQLVNFSDYSGKVRMVTWIYTHCTQGCSTEGLLMFNLLRELRSRGLSEEVQGFIIDFDYLFDNATLLKNWANQLAGGGELPTNLELLLGSEEQINKTAQEWNFYFEYMNMSSTANSTEHQGHEIVWIHQFILYLIDGDGTLRHLEIGLSWDVKKMADVVEYMVQHG